MLLRFGVTNFASIRQPMEISFVASRAIKDRGPELFPVAPRRDALPVLLIYGANASGKTTVYSALRTMRSHVLSSFARRAPDARIEFTPFALDEESKDSPTVLECDFLIDQVRFHYGFEYDSKSYRREWLYSYPEGQPRLLFDRDVKTKTISFGKHLKGQNRVIESFARDNSLFLSAAAQYGHQQLSDVYHFFAHKLLFVGSSFTVDGTVKNLSGELDPRIISFLKMADTGIAGARFEKVATNKDQLDLYQDISKVLLPRILNSNEKFDGDFNFPSHTSKLSLGHLGANGKPVYLDFNTESRGTVRLIHLLQTALKALDRGGTLVVDELDVSLHTLLAREFVAIFSRSETNPRSAQLLATTHDTNVLSSNYVRRDQVWFAEKSVYGDTTLFPLTDMRTRGSDNLERGYIQGRFGAVPYLGSLSDFIRADSADDVDG
ncbi:ATP-binding protein [Brevundimonas terrae]|uniref:ATP-binding protein n=1 Tax=Brevundimonas terrae TaxID=363631 RepID=A0ABN0YHE4_9CAUL|nr:ATP-binding protein [Brevundimonas terrae]NIJ26943.1 hypothetical protein [Brevundimonas terrae]